MVTDEGGCDRSKQEGERRVRLHGRQRRVQAFQHGNVGIPADRRQQRKRRRQYGERSRQVEKTMFQARTNGVVTCFHLVKREMAGTFARTLPAATCHLARVTTAEQVTLGNISLSCGNLPRCEGRRYRSFLFHALSAVATRLDAQRFPEPSLAATGVLPEGGSPLSCSPTAVGNRQSLSGSSQTDCLPPTRRPRQEFSPIPISHCVY